MPERLNIIVMSKGSTSYKKLKLHQYHSKELKIRLLYILFTWIFTFVVFFFNMDFIIYKCSFTELATALTNTNAVATRSTGLIFTEIFEGFLSYVIFSSYLACLVTLPFIYYHTYNFLLPGISFTEAKFFKLFFNLSFCLVMIAHLIAYNLIIPYAISFFLNFQSEFSLETLTTGLTALNGSSNESTFWGITFLGRVYPWITFLINLFTIINFLFQLPLILFTIFVLIKPYSLIPLKSENKQALTTEAFELNLNQKNVSYCNQPQLENKLTYKTNRFMTSWTITTFLRKLLIFTLVLLTAIFSPPDIYSQIFLLIPLTFVIEIFLFLVFFYLEYLNYTQS